MRNGERGTGTARGFTFVWALAAMAIVSIGLAQVGPLWADRAQRVRETELIRIGTLYAHALAQYKAASPGTLKQYPASLDALLSDSRFLGTQRYLRKLYGDPMRPGQPWGLIRNDDGRITGVYSSSTDVPLRREPLDLGVTWLPAARRYADWRFTPESRISRDQPQVQGAHESAQTAH
jgi:type II secretory pathway pseudopilin PulG